MNARTGGADDRRAREVLPPRTQNLVVNAMYAQSQIVIEVEHDHALDVSVWNDGVEIPAHMR